MIIFLHYAYSIILLYTAINKMIMLIVWTESLNVNSVQNDCKSKKIKQKYVYIFVNNTTQIIELLNMYKHKLIKTKIFIYT